MKVIFVASLGRSGSTVLDMKLGCQPGVIGFGEVWRVIKPHGESIDRVGERPCSCGELARDCVHWGEVLNRIAREDAPTLTKCYQMFFDVLREQLGPDAVIVDSSKSIQALRALRKIEDIDVHVVFLARDVRGWMASMRAADRRKTEMPWGRIFERNFGMFWLAYVRLNILRRIPLWLPNEWLLGNARLLREIAKAGFPCVRISYEQLVFDEQATLSEIEKFMQSDFSSTGVREAPHGSHIVRGNRAAFSQEDLTLRYDASWKQNRWLYAQIMLQPWVAVFNRIWVYRGGSLKKTPMPSGQ